MCLECPQCVGCCESSKVTIAALESALADVKARLAEAERRARALGMDGVCGKCGGPRWASAETLETLRRRASTLKARLRRVLDSLELRGRIAIYRAPGEARARTVKRGGVWSRRNGKETT